ncbi:MAG: tetratricopeptide (TPR) repeat protein [Verrucomicrobiales bacterium]|jgi:tetratricopeptide (TPR) repeat protein
MKNPLIVAGVTLKSSWRAALIALLLAPLAPLPVLAEPHFIAERQEGLKLTQSGKHAEAAAFFVKLAETAAKPEQKADALRHAALATARNKQIEAALLLADQIPLKPESHFARIEIYLDARKWAELLEATEMLDAATWPDRLIYPTLMARARAYSALGEMEAAQRDALQAVKHTISLSNQAAAWNLIAGNALRVGNDGRALEAYAEIIRIRPSSGGGLQRALSERALLLSSLGKHDAALADVAELDENNNNDPHWICTALMASGKIHHDMGDKAKALQSYQQAAKAQGAPAALVDEAKKRLAELNP